MGGSLHDGSPPTIVVTTSASPALSFGAQEASAGPVSLRRQALPVSSHQLGDSSGSSSRSTQGTAQSAHSDTQHGPSPVIPPSVATDMPPPDHLDPARPPPETRRVVHRGTRHFSLELITWRQFVSEMLCAMIFAFGLLASSESERRYVLTSREGMQPMETENITECITTTFGGIAVIYAMEKLSGAFVTPLVVIGTWVSGRIGVVQALLLSLADIAGAHIALFVFMAVSVSDFAVLRQVNYVEHKYAVQQLVGEAIFGFVVVMMVFAVDHRIRIERAQLRLLKVHRLSTIEVTAETDPVEVNRLIAQECFLRPAPYLGPAVVGISAGVCAIYGLNIADQMISMAAYVFVGANMRDLARLAAADALGAAAAGLFYVLVFDGGFPTFEVVREASGRKEVIERGESETVVLDADVPESAHAMTVAGEIVGE